MEQQRIRLLEQFVKDEPDDPFNWFALALEQMKFDRAKALETFEYVLTRHPDYLPTYYHAGSLYQGIGNQERAVSILNAGVDLARRLGDKKTLSELRMLLDDWVD